MLALLVNLDMLELSYQFQTLHDNSYNIYILQQLCLDLQINVRSTRVIVRSSFLLILELHFYGSCHPCFSYFLNLSVGQENGEGKFKIIHCLIFKDFFSFNSIYL